jgi:hypothetical protein
MRLLKISLITGVVLMAAGCGVPMGEDNAVGTAGGNTVKLDNATGNIVIITDGALSPSEIIDATGDLVVPIPAELPQVTNVPQETTD